MKKADYLILTSTETGEGIDIQKKDIIEFHTNPTHLDGLGWNRPGIDYLVALDGALETVLPESSETTADLWGIRQGKEGLTGVPKYLAYVGGRTAKSAWEKDTRTEEQLETLEAVVKFYVKRFPKIQILGFNQIPSKTEHTNPAFDATEWLEDIGIPEANIFKTKQS